MKKYTFLILNLIFLSATLHAQRLNVPTLSPFSEIKQEVGLSDIQITYSRPSAKGRTVFGELVPFGEVWRTGANASTKITVSEDVTLAGQALEAGTYALYTIPNPQSWTMIIHKKTNFRSIAGGKVKPENDAFRFEVYPKKLPQKVETFTIAFADLTESSVNIQLSWEHTMVEFQVKFEVDQKIEAQMAAFLKTPEKVTPGIYFRAAEYYLHNEKDYDQALEWINTALEKSPNNFRYGLLKSKIYNAKGMQEQAISTVKEANKWATEAKNSNYISQTEVYLASITSNKQGEEVSPYQKDVESLDAILKALYASISGEKGEKRDWQRFQYLFIDEAKLIPTGKDRNGKLGYQIMTPFSYVQSAGQWLEENGFYEVEISREVASYGSLVHAFSTYESYRSKADEKPFARGINSIQLLKDDDRWWIVQIYWLGETKENPLPTQFLPKE